jgi:hypothetical protein
MKMKLFMILLIIVALSAAARPKYKKSDLKDEEKDSCEDCKHCCLSTLECGSEHECLQRTVTLIFLSGIYSVMLLTFIFTLSWHCWRKGKGING